MRLSTGLAGNVANIFNNAQQMIGGGGGDR